MVAVVWAIGEATDDLPKSAHQVSTDPEANATAELLATGERQLAALLAIALDAVGVAARLVDRVALTALLEEFPGLVVPGFFGYGASGELHLFGRGGADLSAVYLATALKANRCRLIKDVDGVYELAPAHSAEGGAVSMALRARFSFT